MTGRDKVTLMWAMSPVFVVVALAVCTANCEPAKAAPEQTPLTDAQRDWVLGCVMRSPSSNYQGMKSINSCMYHARILGKWGWL